MVDIISILKIKPSRFDWLVVGTLLALAGLTSLFLWLGDRVGVQVVNISPAAGAAGVSTRSEIKITFEQPLNTAAGTAAPLTVSPSVSGTIRWEGSTLVFAPAAALEPGTTYTVRMADNLISQQGRSLQEEVTWQFQTGSPRLLYVTPDAGGQDQLFSINPKGGEPVQLTREPFGIFDYSLSPDGTTIAYAALREDGGSDLGTVTTAGGTPTPFLACPGAVCNGVAWDPAGSRLIYERRTQLVPGAAPGPPRLYWLSLIDGESVAVFDDTQIIGYGATWSPDGVWLTYVAPSSQGVQVYNVRDGRSLVVPNRMGGLAVWNPGSDTLLLTDIQRSNEGFAVHMLQAVPEGGQLVDLSGEGAPVEDSTPAWSPDGQWIAFTRKVAGAAMGKQIWLMRPGGSDAAYLTNDTEIHHGLPTWSPDGRYLAYQRFPLKEINVRPSIWLLDLETKDTWEVINPGNRPTWLP